MWPKFLNICRTVEENPQKNLNKEIDHTSEKKKKKKKCQYKKTSKTEVKLDKVGQKTGAPLRNLLSMLKLIIWQQ